MTTEQIYKIQWLNRAFHAEKNYKAWLVKLERDRNIAERLAHGESLGKSSGSNSTETALIQLADTEQRTWRRLQELVQIREEITNAIKAVPDLDMQTILVRHYLAYETFEQIADKMHYSVITIRRKHKSALDEVELE